MVKNPPAVRDTWVRSLGWDDPLEKGTATHSSILAWRISRTVYSPWDRRVGHNLSDFHSLIRSRRGRTCYIALCLSLRGYVTFSNSLSLSGSVALHMPKENRWG